MLTVFQLLPHRHTNTHLKALTFPPSYHGHKSAGPKFVSASDVHTSQTDKSGKGAFPLFHRLKMQMSRKQKFTLYNTVSFWISERKVRHQFDYFLRASSIEKETEEEAESNKSLQFFCLRGTSDSWHIRLVAVLPALCCNNGESQRDRSQTLTRQTPNHYPISILHHPQFTVTSDTLCGVQVMQKPTCLSVSQHWDQADSEIESLCRRIKNIFSLHS